LPSTASNARRGRRRRKKRGGASSEAATRTEISEKPSSRTNEDLERH